MDIRKHGFDLLETSENEKEASFNTPINDNDQKVFNMGISKDRNKFMDITLHNLKRYTATKYSLYDSKQSRELDQDSGFGQIKDLLMNQIYIPHLHYYIAFAFAGLYRIRRLNIGSGAATLFLGTLANLWYKNYEIESLNPELYLEMRRSREDFKATSDLLINSLTIQESILLNLGFGDEESTHPLNVFGFSEDISDGVANVLDTYMFETN